MARESYLTDLDRVSTKELQEALIEFVKLEAGTGLGMCDPMIEAISTELARRIEETK